MNWKLAPSSPFWFCRLFPFFHPVTSRWEIKVPCNWALNNSRKNRWPAFALTLARQHNRCTGSISSWVWQALCGPRRRDAALIEHRCLKERAQRRRARARLTCVWLWARAWFFHYFFFCVLRFAGWVFINQRESCEPCPDRCARCKDGNTCLECHPPALLAARGKCLVVNDNIFSDGANKPQLAVGAPESPALNLLVQSVKK